MTEHTLPTIDYLRKRLRYEPETGKLFWFACDDMPQKWKTRYSHKEAFVTSNGNGYLTGVINYKRFYAHRVAWVLHHGEWPIDDIDHINGVQSDNRICNLRAATKTENMHNRSMQSNNTSGACGVYWDKIAKKWVARIKINGRNKNLGRFDSIDEATTARAKANIEYGFTDRHGKANVITSAPNT